MGKTKKKTFVYAVADYSGCNRHIAGIYANEESAIAHAKTEAERVVQFMNDHPEVWRRKENENEKYTLTENSDYTIIQYMAFIKSNYSDNKRFLKCDGGYSEAIIEVVKTELKDVFKELKSGYDFV